MNEQNAVVAMYHTHAEAEAAIQALKRAAFFLASGFPKIASSIMKRRSNRISSCWWPTARRKKARTHAAFSTRRDPTRSRRMRQRLTRWVPAPSRPNRGSRAQEGQ